MKLNKTETKKRLKRQNSKTTYTKVLHLITILSLSGIKISILWSLFSVCCWIFQFKFWHKALMWLQGCISTGQLLLMGLVNSPEVQQGKVVWFKLFPPTNCFVQLAIVIEGKSDYKWLYRYVGCWIYVYEFKECDTIMLHLLFVLALIGCKLKVTYNSASVPEGLI